MIVQSRTCEKRRYPIEAKGSLHIRRFLFGQPVHLSNSRSFHEFFTLYGVYHEVGSL